MVAHASQERRSGVAPFGITTFEMPGGTMGPQQASDYALSAAEGGRPQKQSSSTVPWNSSRSWPVLAIEQKRSNCFMRLVSAVEPGKIKPKVRLKIPDKCVAHFGK